MLWEKSIGWHGMDCVMPVARTTSFPFLSANGFTGSLCQSLCVHVSCSFFFAPLDFSFWSISDAFRATTEIDIILTLDSFSIVSHHNDNRSEDLSRSWINRCWQMLHHPMIVPPLATCWLTFRVSIHFVFFPNVHTLALTCALFYSFATHTCTTVWALSWLKPSVLLSIHFIPMLQFFHRANSG